MCSARRQQKPWKSTALAAIAGRAIRISAISIDFDFPHGAPLAFEWVSRWPRAMARRKTSFAAAGRRDTLRDMASIRLVPGMKPCGGVLGGVSRDLFGTKVSV